MPNPQKPEEVLRRLRAHDPRFVFYSNRGKGSHRMIEHPDVEGRRAACPIPFHKGKDIRQGMLKQIIRRFKLPPKIFG